MPIQRRDYEQNYLGRRRVDVRVISQHEFECSVLADVGIAVEEETGKIYGRLYGAAVDANGEPLPVPGPIEGTPCEGGGTSELTQFRETPFRPKPTDEELAAWAQDIFDRVSTGLPVLLSAVAIEYLFGIQYLTEASKDPNRHHEDDYNEEDAIKDVLAQVEYYLRQLLAAPKSKGRERRPRGLWTAPDLREAVTGILRTLPLEEKTWARVAKVLKEREPNRAPANGEALRQLCRRHELKFRSLSRLKGKHKAKRDADAILRPRLAISVKNADI